MATRSALRVSLPLENIFVIDIWGNPQFAFSLPYVLLLLLCSHHSTHLTHSHMIDSRMIDTLEAILR